MTVVLALSWLALLLGGFLGWQLLRQNGRLLLRLEDLEARLDALEFGDSDATQHLMVAGEVADTKSPNDEDRASRFGNRSLKHSRIKRDGLKAGTPAPDFNLPRSDGSGELALRDLLGKRLLLVFSSPDCGPCDALAPDLEKFYREHPEIELVMIGKGDPQENCAKIKEHGLTFPVVLQQQWEISRRYAMFATPIAYLIDETGVIAMDIAVGVEAIEALLAQLIKIANRSRRCLQRIDAVPYPKVVQKRLVARWSLNPPPDSGRFGQGASILVN